MTCYSFACTPRRRLPLARTAAQAYHTRGAAGARAHAWEVGTDHGAEARLTDRWADRGARLAHAAHWTHVEMSRLGG